MQPLKYADFSLNLHEKPSKAPLCAQMELTFRCNLKCQHCYLGSQTQGLNKDGLDYAALTRIIDELHQAGILWLCFTGGEPFMRADFADIYLYAKDKGFVISILSNATLMSKDLAALFKAHRPFYLEIPMNGAEEKIYEEISGVRGSFKKFLEGIELLQNNAIPFKLKIKVMRNNLGEVDKVKDFADRLGAAFSFSPVIYPRLDGDKTPLEYRIRPDQMAGFFQEEDAQGYCDIPGLQSNKSEGVNRLFRCAAVSGSVVINPSGHLMSCTYLRQMGFDLTNGAFEEGVKFLLEKVIKSNFSINFACASCGIADICQSCPAISQLENGSWSEPVGYFCRVAKIRDEQRKKTFI